MVQKLEENRVPEGWDGVELRWWIKDRISTVIMPLRSPKDNRARHKDYYNDRLIGGF